MNFSEHEDLLGVENYDQEVSQLVVLLVIDPKVRNDMVEETSSNPVERRAGLNSHNVVVANYFTL